MVPTTGTKHRQPRPMGLTLLSLNYQKSQLPEDKEKLLKHLITQYTLQGFVFNRTPVNIPEFSKLTNLPEDTIMQYVSKVGASIGAFNTPDQIQDTLTTIASLSTNWAIQDRGLAMQQLNILQASQGNSYKPFISGEVNRALSQALTSNKNLMELYKTFFTSSNTNILNIYGNNNEQEDYITPQKAFDLLQNRLSLNAADALSLPKHKSFDNKKLIQDEELELLFIEHELGDSPECIEGRSGTDALRAPEPIGLQGVTIPVEDQDEPKSLKAPRRRNTVNMHEEFEKRRGNSEYIDYDEVP